MMSSHPPPPQLFLDTAEKVLSGALPLDDRDALLLGALALQAMISSHHHAVVTAAGDAGRLCGGRAHAAAPHPQQLAALGCARCGRVVGTGEHRCHVCLTPHCMHLSPAGRTGRRRCAACGRGCRGSCGTWRCSSTCRRRSDTRSLACTHFPWPTPAARRCCCASGCTPPQASSLISTARADCTCTGRSPAARPW